MTEDQFFAELFSRLPSPGDDVVVPPGDDCAAVCVDDEWLLLLATDQLIGDRHYELTGCNKTDPELAGRKLLARNLSDIAAMGGLPQYCLVSATLPPAVDTAWMQRFLDGIVTLAKQYHVDMIGGDLSGAPNDAVASLTIVGRVERCYVCRRRGAAPGDLLLATGRFGNSLASGHHLTFEPRCAEGRWLAQTGRVKAMIDVSDGLLIDATRICRASGTSIELNPEQILKRSEGVPLKEALTAGEDYELLAAVARDDAAKLQKDWPFAEVPLRQIGTFHAEQTPRVYGMGGAPLLEDNDALGYDHLT